MQKIKQLNSDINKAVSQLNAVQDHTMWDAKEKERIEVAYIVEAIKKIDQLRGELINRMPVSGYEHIKGATLENAMHTINVAGKVAPLHRDTDFPTHKGH